MGSMFKNNELEKIEELLITGQVENVISQLLIFTNKHNLAREKELLILTSERFFSLKKEINENIIPYENSQVERAKIRKALLDVLTGLKQQEQLPKRGNLKQMIIFTSVLFILIFSSNWLWQKLQESEADASGSFSLTIYVHGISGLSNFIYTGDVKIQLGDFRSPSKKLSPTGEVVFEEIPIKFMDDTIKLITIHPQQEYHVLSQKKFTPFESKYITFEIHPAPLIFQGIVYDRAQTVAGAILNFNSGTWSDTTDNQGRFKIAIPIKIENKMKLSIFYQKKERLRTHIRYNSEGHDLMLQPE